MLGAGAGIAAGLPLSRDCFAIGVSGLVTSGAPRRCIGGGELGLVAGLCMGGGELGRVGKGELGRFAGVVVRSSSLPRR